MTLLCLSDLHAQDGGKDDDFGYEAAYADYDLRELVGECWASGATVILAGDTVELHQSLARIAAHDPAEALDMIFEAHPGIAAIWPYVKVACIGNHEAPFIKPGFKYRGVEFVENAVVDGIWIEHGHAHDPVVARWPKLSRQIVGIIGTIESAWHPDVDRWAQSLWHWLTRTGRHGGNERYWTEVGFAAMERDCQIAVFGHSHQQSAWEGQMTGFGTSRMESGRMSGFSLTVPMHIYNTGHWTNGQRDVTRIEAN